MYMRKLKCQGRLDLRVAASSHVREGASKITLTFLGTRGGIKPRSRLHWRHSALLIQSQKARIMIDCGADWLGRLRDVAPTAIVLTHAHPDHAAGLAGSAPCPVYAAAATQALLHGLPVRDWREVPLARAFTIGKIRFKAVPIEHSVRAPAVGYRVSFGSFSLFYAPDVAGLSKSKQALRGVQLYVGDGAVLRRSMVRQKMSHLIGHAPITVQLDWCESAGVPKAVFTHCGSEIVRGNARYLDALVRRLGRMRGMIATLARDGDRLILPLDPDQAMRRRKARLIGLPTVSH